jgi:hypothetical protein
VTALVESCHAISVESTHEVKDTLRAMWALWTALGARSTHNTSPALLRDPTGQPDSHLVGARAAARGGQRRPVDRCTDAAVGLS